MLLKHPLPKANVKLHCLVPSHIRRCLNPQFRAPHSIRAQVDLQIKATPMVYARQWHLRRCTFTPTAGAVLMGICKFPSIACATNVQWFSFLSPW